MKIVGQDLAVGQLKKALTGGPVVHSYLFLGPEGVGKKTVARWFARTLLCESPFKGEPCGVCRSCLLSAAGTHPDIVWIEPAGVTLKIDQVRSLLREAAFRPCRLSGRRVFAIIGADRMTGEAANALLKILEEPAEGQVFILTAVNQWEVLPTVRSRCQAIRFRSLASGIIEAILLEKGIPPETATTGAHLAEGSAGRALMLAEDPGITEVFGKIRDCLEKVCSMDELGLLELGAELERDCRLEIFLQELAACYHNALVWQLSGNDTLFQGALTDQKTGGMVSALFQYNPGRLTRAYREIQQTRRRLQQNVNKRLCLEVLFLNLAEV